MVTFYFVFWSIERFSSKFGQLWVSSSPFTNCALIVISVLADRLLSACSTLSAHLTWTFLLIAYTGKLLLTLSPPQPGRWRWCHELICWLRRRWNCKLIHYWAVYTCSNIHLFSYNVNNKIFRPPNQILDITYELSCFPTPPFMHV